MPRAHGDVSKCGDTSLSGRIAVILALLGFVTLSVLARFRMRSSSTARADSSSSFTEHESDQTYTICY